MVSGVIWYGCGSCNFKRPSSLGGLAQAGLGNAEIYVIKLQ